MDYEVRLSFPHIYGNLSKLFTTALIGDLKSKRLQVVRSVTGFSRFQLTSNTDFQWDGRQDDTYTFKLL